jgi:hypothetical protein
MAEIQPQSSHLPKTSSRVQRNTAASINRRIQQETDESIEYYRTHPDEIDVRLRELDREWDIERTLEANAAGFGFFGIVLGTVVDRRFLALPAAVTGFLMQHALQGWCPPLSVFRRRGVRTAEEIQVERTALKALRGDFDDVKAQRQGAVGKLLEAVRR